MANSWKRCTHLFQDFMSNQTASQSALSLSQPKPDFDTKQSNGRSGGNPAPPMRLWSLAGGVVRIARQPADDVHDSPATSLTHYFRALPSYLRATPK